MAAKRGLGKGLDSLITPKMSAQTVQAGPEEAADAASAEGGIVYLPVDKIEPNRSQPRKYFDASALRELADSIAQHGVLQPLLVRSCDESYEIIAGERRWRAAKLAGLRTVPALVREVSDRERSEIALIENLQREDLDPIEEASAYRQLIDDYGMKQDELAARVAKSRSAITNSLRLLKLDDRVQEMLRTQQISAGHARALLSVKQKEKQFEIAQQIVHKGLSVRETEKIAQKNKSASGALNPSARNGKETADSQKDAVYQKITQMLCERLGTRVEILDRDGKGKIEISYYSPEDLERLLELLQS